MLDYESRLCGFNVGSNPTRSFFFFKIVFFFFKKILFLFIIIAGSTKNFNIIFFVDVKEEKNNVHTLRYIHTHHFKTSLMIERPHNTYQ